MTLPHFNPMLAGMIENEEQLRTLRFPLLAQRKYDGIRGIMRGGKLVSRKLKPIPNKYLQDLFHREYRANKYDIIEGEFIKIGEHDYNTVQSIVMSEEHARSVDIRWMMYDKLMERDEQSFRLNLDYTTRRSELELSYYSGTTTTIGHIAPEMRVTSVEELLEYEQKTISLGFEGIILRDPLGGYKFGRSTLKEQWLLKYKRTNDAEAEILWPIELLHNNNENKTDARGYTERSSHKHNKTRSGMLGSFWVRGINGRYKGKEFAVAAGCLTHEERYNYWSGWETTPFVNKVFISKYLTYTYAATRGTEEAPVEPRFKCFKTD